ncbi:MAG: hypothetical protein K9M45_07590 [Kiritimatiellales bacterium]|nr:hypothetical protein [Kiritimatiellales bacterium]
MNGRLIARQEFLHQGMAHQVSAYAMENMEAEICFEVTRTEAGSDAPETVFEKCVNMAGDLAQCSNTTLDQLIDAELTAVRNAVCADEDLDVHDP